jgi:hypothetical protein
VSCSKDIKRVIFENLKSRGDVIRTAGYEYSVRQGQTYTRLLESVMPLDKVKAAAAKAELLFNEQLKKDELIVAAIMDTINQGIALKTELLAHAHANGGSSKSTVNKVLVRYEGTNKSKHRWNARKVDKNGTEYYLLKDGTATDYHREKRGWIMKNIPH